MKKIIIGFLAFLLITVGATSYIYFTKKNNAVPAGTEDPGISQEVPVDIMDPEPVTKPKLDPVIQQKVESLSKSSKPLESPGVFLVDEYPIMESPAQVPDYSTLYYQDNEAISVTLYKYPLAETRLKAEENLLAKLGISRADLCKLNIEVGVTGSVNLELAGKNLGVSSCPGSVDLSQIESAQ